MEQWEDQGLLPQSRRERRESSKVLARCVLISKGDDKDAQ